MEIIAELKKLFETSNRQFINENTELFTDKVSERTLCGGLAQILSQNLIETDYSKYFVDVEYNRNNGKIKMILDENKKEVTINCDLIIHSRGKNIVKDNLIAIEMKKSIRPQKEKIKDKNRLIALTKNSYDNSWSADGISLPQFVCGYSIGIYYEINFDKNCISLEYYIRGEKESEEIITIL